MIRQAVMKRNIGILILFALCMLAPSCKNYEAEFKSIEERIEKLKAADQRTREMILAEIDRLSEEIVKRIAQMEVNVHDYLDKSMGKVRSRIDADSDMLHKRIESKSEQLGVSIQDYASRIDQFIRSRQKDFEKSRSNLEKELKQSISDGNAALTRRIRNGLATLDELQVKLPELVSKTQARMDALAGLEDKYKKVSAEMNVMNTRMQAMVQLASDYQDALIDLVATDLDKYASTELQAYYMNITEAYTQSELILEEIEDKSNEMASLYSDMPDVESLLEQAEGLFGDLEDLQASLSGYDPEGEAAGILDVLQEAKDLADGSSYDIDSLEQESEHVIARMESCDDAILSSMDEIDFYMELLQDLYDEMESYCY